MHNVMKTFFLLNHIDSSFLLIYYVMVKLKVTHDSSSSSHYHLVTAPNVK